MKLKRNHKNKKHTQYYSSIFSIENTLKKYLSTTPILFSKQTIHFVEPTKLMTKLLQAVNCINVTLSPQWSTQRLPKANCTKEVELTTHVVVNGVLVTFPLSSSVFWTDRCTFMYEDLCFDCIYKGYQLSAYFDRPEYQEKVQHILDADYNTEDEALIFQYNTSFNYDLFKKVYTILMYIHNAKTKSVLTLYQALIKHNT